MRELNMGVMGTSNKENEYRRPIHPDDIRKIPEEMRKRIFLEKDYGKMFHIGDDLIEEQAGGLMKRKELFESCDIILLPKPAEYDFRFFKEGQILWGWPHCVQGESITQLGIDKRLTFIAWEAMFDWRNGAKGLHTFHKNNELAGYSSVLHALQLRGMTGHYGPPKKAAVISFGSVGRGAIHALKGLGFTDISLFTQRPIHKVAAPIPSIKHKQYVSSEGGDTAQVDGKDMAKELAQYDVIVNAVLQDTDAPLLFVKGGEVDLLKPGSLLVDVSCDTAMGFDFARPTSFDDPVFMVGEGITYYGVDHTPTYLWDSATYEISSALLPFISTVMGGEASWNRDETVRRAIEIKEGRVVNQKILSFQKRSLEYPHEKTV